MELSGELNLLPLFLAVQCQRAEKETLTAGGHLLGWVRDTYAPAVRSYLTIHAPAGKKAMMQRTYFRLPASQLALMTESEVDEYGQRFCDPKLGFGVELSIERGRTDMLWVYPEYIVGGDVASVLKLLWRMAEEGDQIAKLRSDVEASAAELDQLVATLSTRIRDPHPLLESIGRSLRDALRGR
jgi:hypothetical protein